MRLLHDYLLVKEIISTDKIEGTSLNMKYDDTNRFMTVEIVDVSSELALEYSKYYPSLKINDAKMITDRLYKKGNILVITRVAKTPYKDGLFFISFKDVVALEQTSEDQSQSKEVQLSIDDMILR